MKYSEIEIGDTLTCSVTGKQFKAALDGCTTNYAIDPEGRVYSDEGVTLASEKKIRERSGPFVGYVDRNGDLTTWKGHVLAKGEWVKPCKLTRISFIHDQKDYKSRWFRAPDGGLWYGRGSPGVCITVRPVKG
jgi:hypothetical protein